MLILKWGGELTPAGKIQAEELGKALRCMYPGGQGNLLCVVYILWSSDNLDRWYVNLFGDCMPGNG